MKSVVECFFGFREGFSANNHRFGRATNLQPFSLASRKLFKNSWIAIYGHPADHNKLEILGRGVCKAPVSVLPTLADNHKVCGMAGGKRT